MLLDTLKALKIMSESVLRSKLFKLNAMSISSLKATGKWEMQKGQGKGFAV